jgi:hypothetical protein
MQRSPPPFYNNIKVDLVWNDRFLLELEECLLEILRASQRRA